MPAITATAPGKIILFGEHSVVYGRPAIAVPVSQVQARAVVMAAPDCPSGSLRLQAPLIGLDADLADLPESHPLALAVWGVIAALDIHQIPACTIRITSTIPIASGLGSGAAVSIALIRALSTFLGQQFTLERISALAYEVEKVHHGTPSGIDNTVITFSKPVYFVRDQPIEILTVAAPFTIVIGDTGIASPTGMAVGDLRRAWQSDPGRYEPIFDAAGQIARYARNAIEGGRPAELGPLMDENQQLLYQMGVSSPELDRLVLAARAAGALGAKLSGGGRGGNMIALTEPEAASQIALALKNAGAKQTIITRVGQRASRIE